MFLYETHLHTSPVSKCGNATAAESLAFYKELGYDGVFITNHFLDGNLNYDRSAPYDLVVANIVSDIILRLLPDLGAVMAVGGRAILSGSIGERVAEIKAAVAAHGFTLLSEREERDWYGLLIQKN